MCFVLWCYIVPWSPASDLSGGYYRLTLPPLTSCERCRGRFPTATCIKYWGRWKRRCDACEEERQAQRLTGHHTGGSYRLTPPQPLQRRLAFGSRTAPSLHERMMGALHAALRTAGMASRGYIDDFVGVAGSHEDLARQCRYLMCIWAFFIRFR